MSPTRLFLAFASALCLFAGVATAAPKRVRPLADPAVSVMRLEARDAKGEVEGTATGFAVGPFMLVTASHVCEGVPAGGVLVGDTLGEVEIVVFDHDKDLCLARTRVAMKHLVIADYGSVKAGDRVKIVGYPMGIGPFTTEGTVAATAYSLPGWNPSTVLLLSCPAYGGNSGGPVLNARGQVIGVLVGGAMMYPQISLATPGRELVNFINAALR